MTKSKVLIVDDDEDIRTQMKWALAQDYEVLEAGDRTSALQTLSDNKPSLIALDLGLPPRAQDVEEGFRLLEEILQRDGGTKVVVITGRDERKNALEAIAKGAYDFFCKPIDIEELKVVKVCCTHVRAGPGQRDDEVLWEDVGGIVSVHEYVGERSGRVADVLGPLQ